MSITAADDPSSSGFKRQGGRRGEGREGREGEEMGSDGVGYGRVEYGSDL